ncbi:MAG: FAD-binding oxidoreductase, partial [Acidobacteriota bacterium]|nr:FAD-binding oxidoreductase [Acidobacteriota bacterium]
MSRITRSAGAIEPYLVDESRLEGGCAEEVGWPGSAEEAAEMLAAWHGRELPVTVSGGGTGVVGGRVPRGGAVLATERMNRVLDLRPVEGGALLRVQAGVSLAEVQQVAARAGLLYPPDPTETGCLIGGNLATNASGARSLRFGSTRRWVEAVRVALVDGSSAWIRRGEPPLVGTSVVCDRFGNRPITVPVPRWRPPATTKCTAGYH